MAKKEEITVLTNAAKLAEKGAQLFCLMAKQSIAKHNRFAVAISGGATARAMHRCLASPPYRFDLFWQHTHLFWADERMVPYDHPDSNFGTAQRDFLNKIPIPAEKIHPMPVQPIPEKGARLYQRELKTFFQKSGNDDTRFDLVFLGVGKDGHTASLFPQNTIEKDPDQWVTSVKGGDPNVYRLTLTCPVFNQARRIIFLVSGMKKASIIKRLFEGGPAPLPARKIRPAKGTLTWLLDRDAASLLSAEKRKGFQKKSSDIGDEYENN